MINSKKQLIIYIEQGAFKSKKLDVRKYCDRALKLLETIHIVYMNYNDIGNIIKKETEKVTTESELKIFQGLLNELEKRELL